MKDYAGKSRGTISTNLIRLKLSIVLTLFGFFSVGAIFGQETVTVHIISPSVNALVGDNVPITVSTTSTYELAEVQVAFNGQTNNLAFAGGAWTGTLAFAGQPFGNISITATATDDFGVTAQTTENHHS